MAKKSTELHLLASRGDIAGLTEALDGGDFDIDAQDHNGMTPAMVALRSKQPEAAALLLDRGTSLIAKDHGGRDLLHWTFDEPNLAARIKAMGGGYLEKFPTPYDEPNFDLALLTVLRHFRKGRALATPNTDILALLEPLPPPDLAALIHTWAHLHARFTLSARGYWLQPPPFRAKESELESIHGGSDAHGISIGQDPGSDVNLIASWRPGARRAVVHGVHRDGPVDDEGDLAAFGY